jgi:hypothetical protein
MASTNTISSSKFSHSSEGYPANGTLTIRRGLGVIDRVNIRRLRPAYLL